MTRQEAADYLRVSMRTLARLPIERSMINSSVRYSRQVLDDWMASHASTPNQKKRTTDRVARVRPGRRTDAAELVEKILKRARR